MVSSAKKKSSMKEDILQLAKAGKIDEIIELTKKFEGFGKICVEALYQGVEQNPKLLKEVIGGLIKDDISPNIIGDLGKHVRQNTLLEQIKGGNLDILKTLQKEDSPLLDSHDFMERATKLNPEALKMASEGLRSDPSFMTSCIAEDIECYKYMDPHLKENATFTMGMMVELNQKHGFDSEALRKLASEMAQDPEFANYYNNGRAVEGNFEDLCRTVSDKKQLDNVSNPAVCDFLATATNSNVPLATNEDRAFAEVTNTTPTRDVGEDMMKGVFDSFKKVVKPMIAEFDNPASPSHTGMLTRIKDRILGTTPAHAPAPVQTLFPPIT